MHEIVPITAVQNNPSLLRDGGAALDSCWYAVVTQPRHEKVVAEHFRAKSIESFLPLFSAPSRWKDRRVILERPFFPGYVFIRMNPGERHRIFGTAGVVRMLSFGGAPAVIDNAEIDAVRLCLTRGNKPGPHPYLATGESVRVISGPLSGLEGVVTRHKSGYRIVVSISLIHGSITAEVDLNQLEPLGKSSGSSDIRRVI